MKLFSPSKSSPRRKVQAFTLVEMMIASAIYIGIFLAALVAIQVYALRVYTLGATKLTATQGCRKTMDVLRDDIRQGKLIYVGNVTNNDPSTFTSVATTNAAIGNALEIYQTTNQNAGAQCSIYYLQTNPPVGGMSSNNLMWFSINSSGATNTQRLTTYITNSIIFTAIDPNFGDSNSYYGTIISNNARNNQVFTVTLQYYQWEYPVGYIGGVGFNAYDYYQLRTRVCRRAID